MIIKVVIVGMSPALLLLLTLYYVRPADHWERNSRVQGKVGWAIEAKEVVQAKGQLATSFESFKSPSPAEELEPPK